jgi:magnesium-transporting ATPase (P-type)
LDQSVLYDNTILDTYPNPNYDTANGSFAALQRCATLCNSASFVESSKTDENGKPVEFKRAMRSRAAAVHRSYEELLYLGVVLAGVVTTTAVFSYLQNRKTSKPMESFKGMVPPQVVCIRGGVANEIAAKDLVRGDIAKAKGGDKIPADVRVLVCSDNCQVDSASLTGESEPIKRTDRFTHEDPLSRPRILRSSAPPFPRAPLPASLSALTKIASNRSGRDIGRSSEWTLLPR